MPTLDLDGVADKYAVYNGTSDAPLYNPLANLSSLLWHSDLQYIGVQNMVAGTVNLDPLTSGWVGTSFSGGVTYPYTYTLATHGLSYSPYFLGYIDVAGEKLPLNGSFLYGYNAYNVYSDATGIRLVCDRLVPLSFDYNVACPFSVSILNSGTDASNAAVAPSYFNGLDATPTRMRCGYFDTDNRYLIKATSGTLRFHSDATIDVQIFQPKYRSSTCRAACVVFKSGSYIHTDLASNASSTAFAAPYYQIAAT